jgi:hypothetical protein
MNLQAIIERRGALAIRLAALVGLIETEARTLTDAEVSESETLEAEDASLAKSQNALEKQAARVAAQAALAAQPARPRGTPATPSQPAAAAPAVLTKTTQQQRNGDRFQGESWARMRMAQITAALAVKEGHEPLNVPRLLAQLYPGRPELSQIAAHHMSRRFAAGVEGGSTITGESGAELLKTDATFTGDFIEFLYSQTLFDQLGLRDIGADVTIKGMDGAFGGGFIGQTKPIKVSVGSFSSVTLRELKAAGLCYLSKELIRRSAPEALMLFRDGITEAISQAVDTLFFSATSAAADVSPAGILVGVSGAASVGGRIQDLYADLQYLTDIFVTAKQRGDLTLVSNKIIGNQIAHLISPLDAQPVFKGQVTKDGGNVNGLNYKTGDNVTAGNLLLIKGSDIYKIADGGVEVSLSTDATIEADTAPTGEGQGPTAQSVSMVSMFQTEMVAIKAVRNINWGLRRAAAIVVARKTGVKYDNTASTTD